mgnify:FL=1
MDLSVIITAHKEGLYLYKTLLSVQKSLEKLSKVNTEIVINLDNADKETKRVANLCKRQDLRVKLYDVSFGNPADNRNDAISKAKGVYIAILDGDDLISENWLSSAYDMIKQQHSKDIILRPEAHIQFGYNEPNYAVWRMRSSSDKAIDAVQMAYWNLWTNCMVARKDTLEKVPFRNAKNGFGFEDYLFATETVAYNIANIIVPETALFYRRRENSTSMFHIDTILDYSPLFDVSYMQSIPLQKNEPNSQSLENIKQKMRRNFKRGYRFAFDTAKKIGPINRVMAPSVKKILYKKNIQIAGQWLIDSMRQINAIDNQIYPTEGVVALMKFHPLTLNPYECSYGVIYQQLCHQMSSDHLDYLFLAPAMSGRGGTEKLIANYIKALKKVHPEWKIGILSTQPFNDLTIDYFNDLDVDMLDFGRLTLGIGNYEKDIIWSRLLVQSKVKRLHLVNDEYWYRWISRHKVLLINNNYKINVSLFMREFTHEKGRILSFADPYISEIWTTINKVFTDNRRVIDEALENNAFDSRRMVVHYQPQDFSEMTPPKDIETNKPLRVLWASRISHQKRPDIIKQIAKKMGSDVTIDAYGIIEKKQYTKNYFSDSPVCYKGSFSGISSINTSQYDAYLYTSQTDGLPNILMEVAAAGLPIIASDVGGVGEFVVNNKAGRLIPVEDINGYASALRYYKNNPMQAKKYAKEAQRIIRAQHSWVKFEAAVEKDID